MDTNKDNKIEYKEYWAWVSNYLKTKTLTKSQIKNLEPKFKAIFAKKLKEHKGDFTLKSTLKETLDSCKKINKIK